MSDTLEDYRRKRDFRRTPEPQGNPRDDDGRHWVIQQHAASSMHFDLRLEVDGVLKSWAVPKGPSTDPRQRRLAIATEDHPLNYVDFEGVIPEDEYGGGAVIVWDRGHYRNLREDLTMAEALADGLVEVALDGGEKLAGGYALKHTGDRNWLLIKMKDEAADARRNPVSTEPESVISGRTIEEVAEED